MRRRRGCRTSRGAIGLVALGALVATTLGAVEPATAQPAGSSATFATGADTAPEATVTGLVTFADGRTASGATVTLCPETRPSGGASATTGTESTADPVDDAWPDACGAWDAGVTAVSGADGRFTIARARPGRHRLLVEPPLAPLDPFAAPTASPLLDVVAGAGTEHAVTLRRGGLVAGTVRTPDGAPARTSVQICAADGRCDTVPTAADGTYTSPVPLAGPTAVVQAAALPGTFHGTRTVALSPLGTVTDTDVILDAGATLDGQVLDPAGAPVAGAIVTAVPGAPNLAVTGPEGRFALRVPASGDLTVNAVPPSSRSDLTTTAVALSDEGRSGATLALPAASGPGSAPTAAAPPRPLPLADGTTVATDDGQPLRGAAWLDPSTIGADLPVGMSRPVAVTTFVATTAEPGGTVDVTVTSPAGSLPAPSGAEGYAVAIDGTWVDATSLVVSQRTNAVTLRIADGGFGDADGIANGVVVSVGGSVHFDVRGRLLGTVDARPVVNTGDAGQIVPLRFQLIDGDGTAITSMPMVRGVRHRSLACASVEGSGDDELTTAPVVRGLRHDGESFAYDWLTPSEPGCYELIVDLAGGTSLRADVRLR